jgi:hypothetical protein
MGHLSLRTQQVPRSGLAASTCPLKNKGRLKAPCASDPNR